MKDKEVSLLNNVLSCVVDLVVPTWYLNVIESVI